MAVLGSVEELIPSMVDEQAVSILRKVIDARAEVFFFDCKLCGAERPASVVDPGVLMFRDYTCADVSTRCTTPPSPKAGKRFVTLRPGSLVFAPIDPKEKTMWPGIIEDCPDGTDAYMIPGKTPNKTKAYFVTFIFPKDLNRKWLGGYIAAGEIRPLEQPCNTQAGFGARSAEYNKSVQIAYRAVPLSLKERILKFSFVAHVASQRNIKMNGNSPDFWSMFAGKRKSSSTDESPGSPKEAAESVPSYSTKLPKLTLTCEDFEAEDLTMVKSEHVANPEHTKPVAKGVSKPEESADHSD